MSNLCCIEEKCVSKNDCPIIKHFYENFMKKDKEDAINEVIEIIKYKKMKAYLTLANGCNEKMDFAYQSVANYLDEIIEQIKEKNNGF